MNEKLTDAFSEIHAEESLKLGTLAYLYRETNGYRRRPVSQRRHLVAAAILLCLLVSFGGYRLYFTPAYVLSVDLNPSLELSVNRFDRVIRAEGINSDGRALVDALNLTFLDCADAVEEILTTQENSEAWSDETLLSVTVVSADPGTGQSALSRLETCFSNCQSVHCSLADAQDVAAAHAAGLSYGKYQAYLEAKALYPDLTPEDVMDMTMRELRDLIEQGGASASWNSETCAPGQHGNGHGHGCAW